MGELVKFQTKQEKAKAERLSLTFHVQTDILDGNSVWYRIGSLTTSSTQASLDKEIIWDEWRKVDE